MQFVCKVECGNNIFVSAPVRLIRYLQDRKVLVLQKKSRESVWILDFSSGDPAGIRTPDTLLKRQVLCRLSYWVI